MHAHSCELSATGTMAAVTTLTTTPTTTLPRTTGRLLSGTVQTITIVPPARLPCGLYRRQARFPPRRRVQDQAPRRPSRSRRLPLRHQGRRNPHHLPHHQNALSLPMPCRLTNFFLLFFVFHSSLSWTGWSGSVFLYLESGVVCLWLSGLVSGACPTVAGLSLSLSITITVTITVTPFLSLSESLSRRSLESGTPKECPSSVLGNTLNLSLSAHQQSLILTSS